MKGEFTKLTVESWPGAPALSSKTDINSRGLSGRAEHWSWRSLPLDTAFLLVLGKTCADCCHSNTDYIDKCTWSAWPYSYWRTLLHFNNWKDLKYHLSKSDKDNWNKTYNSPKNFFQCQWDMKIQMHLWHSDYIHICHRKGLVGSFELRYWLSLIELQIISILRFTTFFNFLPQ